MTRTAISPRFAIRILLNIYTAPCVIIPYFAPGLERVKAIVELSAWLEQQKLARENSPSRQMDKDMDGVL